jgi:DNA-directed RNA polymerase specialized sigma24 family protein/anti-sigma factor ChrR (cupin superfamily)
VNQELEPRPEGTAASQDQSRRSVSSDLQYISLQVDGKPYGGWYRLLPDGRMELLALANMHCERRAEKTPIEQARGMLVDFIRASRKGNEPTPPDPVADEGRGASTLGDLLYADKSQPRIPEDDWIALVSAIAAGDQRALDELFVRAHGIVYTLIVRLTGKPEVAEELTLRVFQDVWQEASRFDARGGPVLAWLSNQARLRAIERLELERDCEDEAIGINDHGGRLRNAVTGLSESERRLIEGAYFSRLSCRELAAEEQRPVESVQKDLQSAMEKLRVGLCTEADRLNSPESEVQCDKAAVTSAYALGIISRAEAPALEAHFTACNECSSRLNALRPVVASLALWPADVLHPPATLRQRLAERIATETGKVPIFSHTRREDSAWEQVSPGITCKLLATDSENERVSMLVRLAPSVDYPPHTHAGREELHLLDGELWIDAKKLYPGDYNRAESGSADHRVWSETGCLCLLITSTRDKLGGVT